MCRTLNKTLSSRQAMTSSAWWVLIIHAFKLSVGGTYFSGRSLLYCYCIVIIHFFFDYQRFTLSLYHLRNYMSRQMKAVDMFLNGPTEYRESSQTTMGRFALSNPTFAEEKYFVVKPQRKYICSRTCIFENRNRRMCAYSTCLAEIEFWNIYQNVE